VCLSRVFGSAKLRPAETVRPPSRREDLLIMARW